MVFFFYSEYTLGGFINSLCSCSIEVKLSIYVRTGIANGPFLRINQFGLVLKSSHILPTLICLLKSVFTSYYWELCYNLCAKNKGVAICRCYLQVALTSQFSSQKLYGTRLILRSLFTLPALFIKLQACLPKSDSRTSTASLWLSWPSDSEQED